MLWLLVTLSLLLTGAASQNLGPQSLVDQGSFSKLRPCAQDCYFYRGSYTSDYIGPRLQCSVTTTLLSRVAENECYCRTDLQLSAHLTISKCVLSRCSSNTNDVTSAWSVYDNYCTSNGYIAGEADSQPTSQAAGGGSRTTPTAGPGNEAPAPTAAATKASAGASHTVNLRAITLLWVVLLVWACR